MLSPSYLDCDILIHLCTDHSIAVNKGEVVEKSLGRAFCAKGERARYPARSGGHRRFVSRDSLGPVRQRQPATGRSPSLELRHTGGDQRWRLGKLTTPVDPTYPLLMGILTRRRAASIEVHVNQVIEFNR